jgi:hypothetical protein
MYWSISQTFAPRLREATMHAKHASKRKLLKKAVPMVGIAGVSLAMAGGASAATAYPTANLPSQGIAPGHEITLGEEEFSDVSLATFFVFDKESTGSLNGDIQLARGGGCGGHGGGHGCGGHGGGARGCGGHGGHGCGGRGCGGRGCGLGGCGCWGGCGCGCCLSWGGCALC